MSRESSPPVQDETSKLDPEEGGASERPVAKSVGGGASPVGRLPEDWQAELDQRGEARFRGKQIFQWIHRRGVFDAEAMTNLGAGLRQHLAESGLSSPLQVRDVKRSGDGTRKILFEIDGGGFVEAVLIPMTPTAGELDADAAAGCDDEEAEEDSAPSAAPTRVTLCISTQHGCAMGCKFCASGQAGLQRGLVAGEIVSQVILAQKYLGSGEVLRNLVFMGMGEPLHHYAETARALRILSHPDGQNISPRRITVSTVGLVPGIRKLGEDFGGRVGLAISLHAPDDVTRSKIIPMNERFSVAELMASLHAYPLPKRRRITIEYTLIDGVNDSLAHATQLAELLRGLPVKVNLIPMNPIGESAWRAPAPKHSEAFRRQLSDAGYSCFLRIRRGDEVDAACGQLALHGEPVRLRKNRLE